MKNKNRNLSGKKKRRLVFFLCFAVFVIATISVGIGLHSGDVQKQQPAADSEAEVTDVQEEQDGQEPDQPDSLADSGEEDDAAWEQINSIEENKGEQLNKNEQPEKGVESRPQAVITGEITVNAVIADTLPAKSLADDRANANNPDSNKLAPTPVPAQNEEDDPQASDEPDTPQYPDNSQDPDLNPATGMYYQYDSREYGVITPVKDQGAYNTCWAFAANAAAEASILSKQADEGTPDLSELQLLYFFYHSVADKLGNTAGDGTIALGGLDFLERGGNEIFATFALANRTGFTEEERLPYEQARTDTGLEESALLYDVSLARDQDTYFLDNAYWISYKDTAVMKQAVIDYGAAAFQFYSSRSVLYYNEKTYGYYCDTVKPVNHAAVIVGWDDTYSRENFTKDPGVDGAWLVKNSYGTGLGDQGYIWVSYADKAFTSDVYKAYVFDACRADNSTLYQYDGSNGYLYSDVKSGSMAANVFQAQAPGASGSELLTKVSFALYDTYVNYDVQIYRLGEEAFENGVVVNPLAGQPCIDSAHKVSGQTTVTGYYTIELEEPVELSPGETFAVVATYSKNDGSDIGLFVDGSYQNGSWIKFVNEVHAGESFLYEEGAWNDLADDSAGGVTQPGLTVRLKAVTVPR